MVLGGTPGARPRRAGSSFLDRGAPTLRACHARWEGFDLHAAVRVPAGPRERFERVCRHALRPLEAGAPPVGPSRSSACAAWGPGAPMRVGHGGNLWQGRKVAPRPC